MILTFPYPPHGGNSEIEIFSFQVFTKMLKTEIDMKSTNQSFGIEVKNSFKYYLAIEKTYFKRPKTEIFVHQCERIFLAAEDFNAENLRTADIRFKTFFDTVFCMSNPGKITDPLSCDIHAVFDTRLDDERKKHEQWQRDLSQVRDIQRRICGCLGKVSEKKRSVSELTDENANSQVMRQHYAKCRIEAQCQVEQLRGAIRTLEAALPELTAAAEESKKIWIAFCRKIKEQAAHMPIPTKKAAQ